MRRDDWAARRAPAMEASREVAENHCTSWTPAEDEILREYWLPDPSRDEMAIAELLGRTTEACLNRAWKLRRGVVPSYRVERTTTTTTTTTETVYRGWKEGDGDGWD